LLSERDSGQRNICLECGRGRGSAERLKAGKAKLRDEREVRWQMTDDSFSISDFGLGIADYVEHAVKV
jgi:hypothetical protein